MQSQHKPRREVWRQQGCVSSLFHLSLGVSVVVKWDQSWKEGFSPSCFSEADSFKISLVTAP